MWVENVCVCRFSDKIYYSILFYSLLLRTAGYNALQQSLIRLPPATQQTHNVVTMSLQRHDVAATLLLRCVFAGYLAPLIRSFTDVQKHENSVSISTAKENVFIHSL